MINDMNEITQNDAIAVHLYDFVTGKVIFSTIVKRTTSRVRRDKSDTQRHAGGRVTALQRRAPPLTR